MLVPVSAAICACIGICRFYLVFVVSSPLCTLWSAGVALPLETILFLYLIYGASPHPRCFVHPLPVIARQRELSVVIFSFQGCHCEGQSKC